MLMVSLVAILLSIQYSRLDVGVVEDETAEHVVFMDAANEVSAIVERVISELRLAAVVVAVAVKAARLTDSAAQAAIWLFRLAFTVERLIVSTFSTARARLVSMIRDVISVLRLAVTTTRLVVIFVILVLRAARVAISFDRLIASTFSAASALFVSVTRFAAKAASPFVRDVISVLRLVVRVATVAIVACNAATVANWAFTSVRVMKDAVMLRTVACSAT